MARIIEQGTKLDVIARQTCHKCGSEVEFEKGDVQNDQRGENYVKCPACETFIDSSVLNWGPRNG